MSSHLFPHGVNLLDDYVFHISKSNVYNHCDRLIGYGRILSLCEQISCGHVKRNPLPSGNSEVVLRTGSVFLAR